MVIGDYRQSVLVQLLAAIKLTLKLAQSLNKIAVNAQM